MTGRFGTVERERRRASERGRHHSAKWIHFSEATAAARENTYFQLLNSHCFARRIRVLQEDLGAVPSSKEPL
jgi:hypothetical protein